MKKEIKDIHCKGRLKGTSMVCNELLFQTDGEFLMVAGLIVNPEFAVQQVVCKCGKKTVWHRRK